MKTKTSPPTNSINRSSRHCGRIAGLLIPLVLALTWLTLAPKARAVCQEGCLTNENTVLGDDALLNNTGSDNTALGFETLFSDTSGGFNTAVGARAMISNSTGGFNTAVGYIALFGIAVETGVVMVVYLHEALEHKLQSGKTLTNADVEEAVIEGAVHRLRPKLMTVCAVLASLVPILWESGIGSDVMKPIAAPIVGGMITSTIHVLILVPVFFVMMKERSLKRGTLTASNTVP